jgi:hypothetical protein
MGYLLCKRQIAANVENHVGQIELCLNMFFWVASCEILPDENPKKITSEMHQTGIREAKMRIAFDAFGYVGVLGATISRSTWAGAFF